MSVVSGQPRDHLRGGLLPRYPSVGRGGTGGPGQEVLQALMGITLAKLPSTYQTLLYTNQALDWDMPEDQIRSFHGYEHLDAKQT